MRRDLSIWWIKRDCRVQDNKALVEALKNSTFVLPIFVFEPQIITSPESSKLHLNAQLTALTALRKKFQMLGADICVLTGNLPDIFIQLHKQYFFTAIYSHQETGSNVTYQRDIQVAAWCSDRGITWNEYPQNAVIRGRRLEKLDKKYWNTFINQRQATTVTHIPWSEQLQKLCVSNLTIFYEKNIYSKLQPVTEDAGQRVLKSFFDNRGETYWGSLSSPNTAWFHGSRLSPHLAWGTVSLRNVFQSAQKRLHGAGTNETYQWRRSLEAFTSRLYWHDHFMQKLESFPELEFYPADRKYSAVMYKDSEESLQLWLQGKTGFPMIDATMRCLKETGFVNFRMRAMAISFAAYGLHLSWKKILYPFAKLMADYEPGIHIYQVQMQSGVTKGNSMRVYNPLKQLLDKDPQCLFIKKWIPELHSFTPSQIFVHLNNSEKFGLSSKNQLGTYPNPYIHFTSMSKLMKDILISCDRKVNYQTRLQLSLF